MIKIEISEYEIIYHMGKRFTPKGALPRLKVSFPSLASLPLSLPLPFSLHSCFPLPASGLAGDKHPLTFQLSYYFYPARVTGHKGSLSIESTLSVQLNGVPAARTIAKPRLGS